MPPALPTTLPQSGRIWTGRRAAGPTPGEHRPSRWVPGGECARLRRGEVVGPAGVKGAPCCSVSLPGAMLSWLLRGKGGSQ